MLESVSVSFPLAFVAGLVSFLSPCVLPVVPGYVTFVSGMTLDELGEDGGRAARRTAVVHTALFALGFGLVFMTLGAAASAFGQAVSRSLPLLMRLGGVLVILFGLYLLGAFRWSPLLRERRFHLARKPGGVAGSVLVGMAFGAGWTPCIGPILATILLYASLEGTVIHGTLLLGAYGLGLAVPFVLAAGGLGWFLGSRSNLKSWALPLQRTAGALLVAMGILMASGHFAALTRSLAGMGQLINLELQ
jgi:cytochrome c-type biogenesis protein